jgi:hypothetical protein
LSSASKKFGPTVKISCIVLPYAGCIDIGHDRPSLQFVVDDVAVLHVEHDAGRDLENADVLDVGASCVRLNSRRSSGTRSTLSGSPSATAASNRSAACS